MDNKFKIPTPITNPILVNTAISNGAKRLISRLGLQNLAITNAKKSPFEVPQGQSMDVPQQNFISKIGTPVLSNIVINAGKYTDNKGKEIKWDDFRIDDILISVTQSKKIVTTEIQGRDGTVKEYIGMDDFHIAFNGRITGDYGVYEKENVRLLKQILSADVPLEISSWYLQNLDINTVVVTNFDISQAEGQYSTQYFSFQALSDNVVEALIIGQ